MSILTECLPDYLIVGGKKQPIRSDFKTWLKFSVIMSKGELTEKDLVEIFKLVFFDLPLNIFEALNAIFEFYSHDVKSKKNNTNQTEKNSFDFEYDAELIYSAFMQQYDVDLCDSNMHWWKFKSLFGGLSEDTHFVKVVQYRTMDLSKIKDKAQKKHYLKMKALYKLPDNRSEEQKENSFSSMIEKMF